MVGHACVARSHIRPTAVRLGLQPTRSAHVPDRARVAPPTTCTGPGGIVSHSTTSGWSLVGWLVACLLACLLGGWVDGANTHCCPVVVIVVVVTTHKDSLVQARVALDSGRTPIFFASQRLEPEEVRMLNGTPVHACTHARTHARAHARTPKRMHTEQRTNHTAVRLAVVRAQHMQARTHPLIL